MNAGEICNREVVVAYRNTTLFDAARLMHDYHDLLDIVAEQLQELVRAVERERVTETRLRPSAPPTPKPRRASRR
jgi:CBS domain